MKRRDDTLPASMSESARTDGERALQAELDADDGSFLLQLRCDLRWDPVAVWRLTDAVADYARSRDPEADLPRWAACDFCYASWFVRSWVEHPSFPRTHPAANYEAAFERLSDLAHWLSTGESVSTDESWCDRPLPGESDAASSTLADRSAGSA